MKYFLHHSYTLYKQKLQYLNTYFCYFLNYFFIGFILGNIFGSCLIFLRNWFIWDGFLILCIILILDYFNVIYKSNLLNSLISNTQLVWYSKKIFYGILLNSIRIGFLLGFVIDAYKVAS